MAGPPRPPLVWDMAVTRAEFLRSLPAAAHGMECRISEGGALVLLLEPPRRVEIRLGPEERRRLGALSLPRTRVGLSLEGFADAEAAAFLERFARAYQRGGG